MGVAGLRDRNGKITGRIARDVVLQVDDNVLDHRDAPIANAEPSQRALSSTPPLLALMPVNERGPSLIEAEATNHQLFTHSSGTNPCNRGCNGTVLHDYLFRVPARALLGLRLSRGVPCCPDSPATASLNPGRSTKSMPRYFFHFRAEAS